MVTLSICGIFKEVVTISAAGIIFHDELSVVNISGLLVTIISIGCYNYLKVMKMREDAREQLKKKDEQEYHEAEDDDDDSDRMDQSSTALMGDAGASSNNPSSGSSSRPNYQLNGALGASGKPKEATD